MKNPNLSLEDPRWKSLDGGYRRPYDASRVFKFYEMGEIRDEDLWTELWGNLHHQGDVGSASYASVIYFPEVLKSRGDLDWNPFSLAATIENCRQMTPNPPLPEWLQDEYSQALSELIHMGAQRLNEIWSRELSQSFLMLLATWKGLYVYSEIIAMAEDELKEVLRIE